MSRHGGAIKETSLGEHHIPDIIPKTKEQERCIHQAGFVLVVGFFGNVIGFAGVLVGARLDDRSGVNGALVNREAPSVLQPS